MEFTKKDIKKVYRLIKNKKNSECKELFNSHPELLHKTYIAKSWLNYSAKFKNMELCEYFFEKGLEINSKGKSDVTPLREAVCNSDEDLVSWFLQNGADVESHLDVSKKSNLIQAIQENNLNIVKLLTENGANVNHLFNIYYDRGPVSSVLDQAYLINNPDIIRYLKKNGANKKSLKSVFKRMYFSLCRNKSLDN